jgi:hypothetical protein
MRVLIYKRTHEGDPDHLGQFGIRDCMGSVRSREFDAVVGVGGIGPEPRNAGIAGKVNWIGVGAHRRPGIRGPIISFDHFLDYGISGPPLVAVAPKLANRIYGRNVRSMMHVIDGRRDEVARLIGLAESAPASAKRRKYGIGRMPCRRLKHRSGVCPPRRC